MSTHPTRFDPEGNTSQPQAAAAALFLERPMFHHQRSSVVHLHHRESTSA